VSVFQASVSISGVFDNEFQPLLSFSAHRPLISQPCAGDNGETITSATLGGMIISGEAQEVTKMANDFFLGFGSDVDAALGARFDQIYYTLNPIPALSWWGWNSPVLLTVDPPWLACLWMLNGEKMNELKKLKMEKQCMNEKKMNECLML
jgi:hypothetical protein